MREAGLRRRVQPEEHPLNPVASARSETGSLPRGVQTTRPAAAASSHRISNAPAAMHYWTNTYYQMLMKFWIHLTPMQYGFILVGIGVFGWVLMKTDASKFK